MIENLILTPRSSINTGTQTHDLLSWRAPKIYFGDGSGTHEDIWPIPPTHGSTAWCAVLPALHAVSIPPSCMRHVNLQRFLLVWLGTWSSNECHEELLKIIYNYYHHFFSFFFIEKVTCLFKTKLDKHTQGEKEREWGKRGWDNKKGNGRYSILTGIKLSGSLCYATTIHFHKAFNACCCIKIILHFCLFV